jgi:hypothetical protein
MGGKTTMADRRRNLISNPNRLYPMVCAVIALALGAHSNPCRANDDRPKEIPYETAGGIPSLSNLSSAQVQRVVTVTDHGLQPEQIVLAPTERLAWMSYAGEATTIVFEREVAGAMSCRNLVNFYIEEDELKSGDIHALDLVHFCDLEPGIYHYNVVRKNPASRAKRRMKGTIVVGSM